jgi:hypothetical protein
MRLPIDYGDNFEEFAATHGAPLLENLRHEFADPKFYFRPFEIVWRYLIAFGFREGVAGYNRFMVIESTLAFAAFALVCRPGSARDLAACLVALAVLVGHHATQAIWEGATIISNGLVLMVAILSIDLTRRPASAGRQAAAVLLTLLCLLTKELGLVVATVFLTAHMLRMPGIRRPAAAAIALITACYLVFHWATLPDLALGHANRAKSAAQYVSNVVATIVMFWIGLPFDGDWTRSALFLHQPWQWVQIAAGFSTLLLFACAWILSSPRMPAEDGEPALERRWLLLFAAALSASAAVSFQITRHRQGAPAVPFLAYGVYLSMRMLLQRLDAIAEATRPRAPVRLTVMAAAALACATLWPVRVVSGFEYLRLLGGRMHADFGQGLAHRWTTMDEQKQRLLIPFVEPVDELPWPRRNVPILDRLGDDIEYSVNR